MFLVGLFSDLDSVGVACTPKKVRVHILFPIIIKVESSCQVKGNYPPNKRGNIPFPAKITFESMMIFLLSRLVGYVSSFVWRVIFSDTLIFHWNYDCRRTRKGNLQAISGEKTLTHPLSWFVSLKNLFESSLKPDWQLNACLCNFGVVVTVLSICSVYVYDPKICKVFTERTACPQLVGGFYMFRPYLRSLEWW